jgi:hypothetical protein
LTNTTGPELGEGMKAVFVRARAPFNRCVASCSAAVVLIALVGCSNDHSGEEALKKQFPELASAVNDSDRAEASTEIGRTDGNGDDVVTEAEWIASKYQPAERFKLNDLNGDGVLTPYEHSLRWAQYRLEREARAKKAAKKK